METKTVKIPISWVEYHSGELVMEVPKEMTLEDIKKLLEEYAPDKIAFNNVDDRVLKADIVRSKSFVEYDEYNVVGEPEIIEP